MGGPVTHHYKNKKKKMQGALGGEKKKGVTFEDEVGPGANASLKDKIVFAYNKSFLADPTKRFLLYNVSLFGVAVAGIVKYGEALAI